MLRPTPPRDVVTWPGLESRATSFPADTAPMSMFTPPTTATYGAVRTMYPLPVMQPFFIRLDMCTATLERVMPALSASSCCEIMGFSRIHSSSWRSRWVTGSPPKQKFVF